MNRADILSLIENAENAGVEHAEARRRNRDENAPTGAGEARPQVAAPAFDPGQHTPVEHDVPLEPSVQTRPQAAAAAAVQAIQADLPAAGSAPAQAPGRSAAPVGNQEAIQQVRQQAQFQQAPTMQYHPQEAPQPMAAPIGAGAPNAPASSWHDSVPTSSNAVVVKGLLFVFGFLGIFALWSVLSPIASAVVASGKLVSLGQNKLIQHPIGGVVRDILVADGQEVEAGDVIAVLDSSSSQAEYSRLRARQRFLLAQQARYQAETSGEDLSFQDDGALDAETMQMVDEQRREFAAGRKRLTAQVNAIEFQIETFKDQIVGLQARADGARKLLQFTNSEIARVRPLAESGYLPKSRLWDLEKTKLEQLTAVENFTSEVAATRQRIAEAESNLAGLEELDRETRSEELTRVLSEMAEIRDQLTAAETAVNLTTLRAPVSGTVVKLAVHTKGGVIQAGLPIAEIVPEGTGLEVEFRVPLDKAKSVYAGQNARITVTAFNRRTYDPIDAEVTYRAADSVVDEQTGEAYFLARAGLKPDAEKNQGIDEISAGMAAEVYVLATPRNFLSYVVQPVVDSFSKAFREVN